MAGSDSTLYLYTSLTAGSSHIITATSRLETILKANRIPFQAIDIATDDVARRLWGRYSKGRKLPGLVKFKTIVGDLEQIEDWNEYGELKDQIGSITDPDDFSSGPQTASQKQVETEPLVPKPAPAFSSTTSRSSTPHVQIQNPPVSEPKEDQRTLALRLAGEEAAAKAKENARSKLGAKPPTTEAEGKAPPTSDPKAKGTEAIPETAGKSTAAAAEEEKKEQKEKVKEEENQSGSRRASVVPEIVPSLKRPSLADETAAVSSANFHVDNAELLGLVGHHRGSIISATTHDEQEQVRSDIRASISEAPADGDIEALRKTAADGKNSDTILEDEEEEEDDSASDEDEEVKKEKKEVKKEQEEVTKGEKKKEGEQEKEIDKDQDVEEKTAAPAPAETDDTQKQDPKDESKAGVSVED